MEILAIFYSPNNAANTKKKHVPKKMSILLT